MKKKTILFGLSLFVLYVLFSLPCHGDLVCTGPATEYLEYPFVWFLIFIPISLLALTLNDHKHLYWLKFTSIFFGISMVLVYMTPEYGSGLVSLDRELVNWFLAGLYSFISIIYFAIHFFKKKKS